jgi:hypothetical protein
MPVSDVGRKGWRIDRAIALLLQRRDPHWLAHVRRRDTANVVAYLDVIGFLRSYSQD